jgi:hypothetical protein
MIKKIIFVLIAYALLVPNTLQATEQTVMTFSTVKGSALGLVSADILKEAYRRIGIQINVLEVPAKRGLHNANFGRYDGEVMRIAGIAKAYPNLIMVPDFVNIMEGVAFSKNKEIQIQGWESLKPYRIGVVRGMKFAENGTKGMERDLVSNPVQLFKMLDRGRLDIAILSRMSSLGALKVSGVMGVYVLSPPLTKIKLYHYLHKRHKNLVPQISKTLQELEKEGVIQKIREQHIAQLTQ